MACFLLVTFVIPVNLSTDPLPFCNVCVLEMRTAMRTSPLTSFTSCTLRRDEECLTAGRTSSAICSRLDTHISLYMPFTLYMQFSTCEVKVVVEAEIVKY